MSDRKRKEIYLERSASSVMKGTDPKKRRRIDESGAASATIEVCRNIVEVLPYSRGSTASTSEALPSSRGMAASTSEVFSSSKGMAASSPKDLHSSTEMVASSSTTIKDTNKQKKGPKIAEKDPSSTTAKNASNSVNYLPANRDTPGFNCCICLDTTQHTIMKYLPCSHGCHELCLDEWLQRSRNCPFCRQVILSPQNAQPPTREVNDNDNVFGRMINDALEGVRRTVNELERLVMQDVNGWKRLLHEELERAKRQIIDSMER